MSSAESELSVVLRQDEPIPLDVGFSCKPDQLLALVGPSGSGKTTILRCIAGLYIPRNGQVVCDGLTWWNDQGIYKPVYGRGVGMVFQSYALFEHMTAAENVATAVKDPSARDVKVNELMALVNLTGLEHRRPAQLSGGQRQRVALARALAGTPRVLLLDEPFSAVDLMTRRKLRRDLARIRRSLNIPIVMVTHDLEEARELADVLCIVHRGRSLQIDAPEQLLSHPVNAEVARLLGHSNIFSGVIESEPGRPHVLKWAGLYLKFSSSRVFPRGEKVQWVIPADRIILHQRLRPSRGEAENPVEGTITDITRMGGNVMVELMPDGGEAGHPVTFNVPFHVAERNSLRAGEAIGISLPTQAIHVMSIADS